MTIPFMLVLVIVLRSHSIRFFDYDYEQDGTV